MGAARVYASAGLAVAPIAKRSILVETRLFMRLLIRLLIRRLFCPVVGSAGFSSRDPYAVTVSCAERVVCAGPATLLATRNAKIAA